MKKVFQILSVVLMSAISVSAMAADAADVLSKLKSRIAPDKRTAIFDVKSTTAGKQVTVTGTVVSLVPGVRLRVTEQASGPVEKYVAPVDRS